jgi:hypothetical protein
MIFDQVRYGLDIDWQPTTLTPYRSYAQRDRTALWQTRPEYHLPIERLNCQVVHQDRHETRQVLLFVIAE